MILDHPIPDTPVHGVVYVAVKGVPCPGSRTACPPMTRAMCRYGGNPHPPPELVALDGAKCSTCEGHGSYYGPQRGRGKAKQTACPSCHGSGKPLVELQWACPHDCQRFGGKVPGHVRGSNWAWVPCWCDGTGTITAPGLYSLQSLTANDGGFVAEFRRET